MARVGFRFCERLEGALSMGGSPSDRAVRLVLHGSAPVLDFLRGEPALVAGELHAPGLLDDAEVRGSVRFVRAARELLYRIETLGPSGVTELVGSKRGLFDDPYPAFTTLSLSLRREGAPIGSAVLRFDARTSLLAGLSRFSLVWA